MDALSDGRSSGGASNTTVGIGIDGADVADVEADADELPSATDVSLAMEVDAVDLTESLRCKLLDRELEPLLADKR